MIKRKPVLGRKRRNQDNYGWGIEIKIKDSGGLVKCQKKKGGDVQKERRAGFALTEMGQGK